MPIESKTTLIEFLQYPRVKRKMSDLLGDAYKTLAIEPVTSGIEVSFSKSKWIYLEHEDSHPSNRLKARFVVQMGDFTTEPFILQDESIRQAVWDAVVHSLIEVVSGAGSKAAYVKNDKMNRVLTMRQYHLSAQDQAPDEFFTFDLRYVDQEKKKIMANEHSAILGKFEEKRTLCRRRLEGWFLTSQAKTTLLGQINQIEKDRDYFLATNLDPRDVSTGLMLSVSMNALKSQSSTQDQMQKIVTQYGLALRSIVIDSKLLERVDPRTFL